MDPGERQHWDPADCEGDRHCPPRCPRFVDRAGRAWTVRRAGPDDRDPLVETYRAFDPTRRAQGLPPATDAAIERWLDDVLSAGVNVVVGTDPVVGHAFYTPSGAAAPELAVFVTGDYEGRGLGRELCEHLIATAAAGGRDALVLHVARRNRRARGLYASLGFERVRPATRDPGGGPITLRLELGDGRGVASQLPPAMRPEE
ncbi:MAG: N-acetyltransferase family protein [Halobacteriaceae archaeon]